MELHRKCTKMGKGTQRCTEMHRGMHRFEEGCAAVCVKVWGGAWRSMWICRGTQRGHIGAQK